MARSISGVLACLVLLGCGREDRAKPAPRTTATAATPDPACAKAKPHGALAWIEDDYAAALACARSRNVPIVLDLWAPWCHTCLSMQTTVFTDASFTQHQDNFVFAALDTDREINALPVGKFSLSAWPTFYVIDPQEQVLARYVGAATVQQFQEFMAAGKRAAAGGIAAADARLLGAERALAVRDLATAAEELAAAIAAAPPVWPRRAEALGSLLLTTNKLGATKQCLELADKHMDDVGRSAIATNFWALAFSCTEPHAKAEPERTKSVQERAVANLAKVTSDPDAPLSVDDRAEALSYLRDTLDALDRKEEAAVAAETLRVLVDDAFAKAPSPTARMGFLWPRAEAYVYLKRPLDLIADFEKVATELPTEYDPPARIGWLYLKAGKLAEAAAWTDKAIALVYGPRKGRLLAQRAEIAAAAGDRDVERRYRAEAVTLWESLPAGQQSATNLAKAKAALAAVDAPSSTKK